MNERTSVRALSRVRTSRLAQAALASGALLFVALVLLFINLKTIQVKVDGSTKKMTTVFNTVGEALAHSKLDIYPEDRVEPSRDTKITSGLEVKVTRSIPVSLSVDGKVYQTRTVANSVGEAVSNISEQYSLGIKDVDEVNFLRTEPLLPNKKVIVKRAIPIHVLADNKKLDKYLAPCTVASALEKLDISLGEKDKVSLPLDYTLEPDDQIKITRVTEKVETVETKIPYQTIAKPADFPLGLADKTISSGVNGAQEQTVRITYEDGKEVDREILGQRLIRPPVNKVVARGTQTRISRGGRVINFKRAYLMRATAYSEPGGTTATGAAVHWGIVAVDPNVIPLGSKVYVEQYGSAMALDTGGAIKGKRIDLYMDSVEAALNWGVRWVVVYVE